MKLRHVDLRSPQPNGHNLGCAAQRPEQRVQSPTFAQFQRPTAIAAVPASQTWPPRAVTA